MSNLIKSSHVVSLEDLKKVEIMQKLAVAPQNISRSDGVSEGNQKPDVETQSLKDRILSDAEDAAQAIIAGAMEEAERIRAQARQDADSWWQSRREEDDQYREEVAKQGYEEGYLAGTEDAAKSLAMEWDGRMQEAQAIVTQAYATKESVIAEAERFAVELSCSIAEKILVQELTEAPELAIKLFGQALSRRKEQGVIVLCVSPKQFAFVQAAKEELVASIDSQAELQIVPDASVSEGGCIVRSAFGSIDARVDTQLEAIKQQLLRIADHSAEEGAPDEAP
ncbi:FliH/SctL family protein [Cohnella panacarvi]|uniref:FliH/SctL family protein n=1 Tax=Cohnella panacarvi TaxID=400776 RepID=UPI000479885C|nr:FliH/SctL family protein [Cohnella panacarvi]